MVDLMSEMQTKTTHLSAWFSTSDHAQKYRAFLSCSKPFGFGTPKPAGFDCPKNQLSKEITYRAISEDFYDFVNLTTLVRTVTTTANFYYFGFSWCP